MIGWSLGMSADADAFDTTLLAESGPRKSVESTRSELQRWVGCSLDHFDVIEPLARGGMGAVFIGHDRSLDRRVAIKVLPEDFAGDAQLQERFIREARAQARLNSRHVVHIYHIGRTPPGDAGRQSLYFAMELVEGGALEGLPRGRRESRCRTRAQADAPGRSWAERRLACRHRSS